MTQKSEEEVTYFLQRFPPVELVKLRPDLLCPASNVVALFPPIEWKSSPPLSSSSSHLASTSTGAPSTSGISAGDITAVKHRSYSSFDTWKLTNSSSSLSFLLETFTEPYIAFHVTCDCFVNAKDVDGVMGRKV